MAERERKRGPANAIGSRCDSCGKPAPPVVGPILLGEHGWREFDIDGAYEGREWKARVLLCGNRQGVSSPSCASKMQAFVDSGGIVGQGPRPPRIVTSEGGFYEDPEWL